MARIMVFPSSIAAPEDEQAPAKSGAGPGHLTTHSTTEERDMTSAGSSYANIKFMLVQSSFGDVAAAEHTDLRVTATEWTHTCATGLLSISCQKQNSQERGQTFCHNCSVMNE